MAQEVKKVLQYSLVISIIRYALIVFIAIMIVFGIFTDMNYPIWMLLILVFLAGLNLGTLIKDRRNNDLTLLN